MDWCGDAGMALAYNEVARLRAGTNAVDQLTYPVPLTGNVDYVVTGTGNSNVWVIGQQTGGVNQFDGTQWTTATVPSFGAYGSLRDAGVYLVSTTLSSTTLYDSTGGHALAVTTFDAGTARPTDIWINSPSDIYAAGATGPTLTLPFLAHWNGAAWSPVATPDAGVPFAAVWSSPAGDVWLGGGKLLLHFNGTQWTDHSATLTAGEYIKDIFGTSPTNVWAGGQRSTYFFDGNVLTNEAAFVTVGANGFVRTAKGELFSFDLNSLHQRVGTTWTQVDIGQPVVISGLYAAPEGGLWLVGFYGSVLFRPP
jgi:hypothetical protein